MKLKTDIVFGDKYREKNTGFVGAATAVYFFEHGCTRVNLMALVDGDVKEFVFDEQALIHVNSDKAVESQARVGGSRHTPSTLGIR